MSNQPEPEPSGGFCHALLAEISKAPPSSHPETNRYSNLRSMFAEHSIPMRDRNLSSMRFASDTHMAAFSLTVGSPSERAKAYASLSHDAALAYQNLCKAIEAQVVSEAASVRTSKYKVLINYF